ncbi:hypothetical protein OG706_22180 [Kitasatospora purpeofusca]|nr:hypothetical protein [Kitasatospora purpeofusca]MCX4756269.1 hypothetical protein [Kitasatospora purpeofusca]
MTPDVLLDGPGQGVGGAVGQLPQPPVDRVEDAPGVRGLGHAVGHQEQDGAVRQVEPLGAAHLPGELGEAERDTGIQGNRPRLAPAQQIGGEMAAVDGLDAGAGAEAEHGRGDEALGVAVLRRIGGERTQELALERDGALPYSEEFAVPPDPAGAEHHDDRLRGDVAEQGQGAPGDRGWREDQ